MANDGQSNFGPVLKELIRRDYHSQKSFAHQCGLSEGRVSQLIQSGGDAIAYATLRELLRMFPRLDDQERLYHAWRRTFAPGPALSVSPLVTDEEIAGFVEAIPRLVDQGQILTVAATADGLWRTLRCNPTRSETALASGRALVETNLLLERRSAGLRVCREMQELSWQVREPSWTANSLWLEALAIRPLFPDQPEVANAAFAKLNEFLASWLPFSATGRAQRQELINSSIRDRLLVAWDASRKHPKWLEEQADRLELFARSLKEQKDPQALAISKEVHARSLISLGRLGEAEEALREAATIPTPDHPITQLKIALTEVRLSLADRDDSEAWRKLKIATDAADVGGFVHYRAELLKLEHQLLQSALRI